MANEPEPSLCLIAYLPTRCSFFCCAPDEADEAAAAEGGELIPQRQKILSEISGRVHQEKWKQISAVKCKNILPYGALFEVEEEVKNEPHAQRASGSSVERGMTCSLIVHRFHWQFRQGSFENLDRPRVVNSNFARPRRILNFYLIFMQRSCSLSACTSHFNPSMTTIFSPGRIALANDLLFFKNFASQAPVFSQRYALLLRLVPQTL